MATDTAPTAVDPAQRAREAFEAIDRHDLEKAARYWGPETVDHFLPVGEYRGTQAIKGYFSGLYAAVPDFRIKVERISSDESATTVQWRATGTFNGAPFQGIEPTGRSIDIRGVDVIEWDDDGTIKHNDIYYDGAEFARQVGMLPPRDSAADRAITAAFNGATKLRARLQR